MHAPDDELEVELNEALRTYTDPPENPKAAVLAARVFAAAKGTRTPGWQWLLRGPAPALACLLIFFVLAVSYQKHRPSPRATHNPLASLTAPARTLQALSNHKAAPRVQVRTRMIRAKAYRRLPKLDQFPQPQPMSEQEKLMLVFVSTAAPEDQRVVAQASAEPEFMRLAELQSPATHSSTLKTAIPGEPYEEHR